MTGAHFTPCSLPRTHGEMPCHGRCCQHQHPAAGGTPCHGRQDGIASGLRGKGSPPCMRWSRMVVAGGLCQAGGSGQAGGAQPICPFVSACPALAWCHPLLPPRPGAAFVLVRSSEDRFSLGSRGSRSQSTCIPEEDGDVGPRTPIPEHSCGPEGGGGRSRSPGLDRVSRC